MLRRTQSRTKAAADVVPGGMPTEGHGRRGRSAGGGGRRLGVALVPLAVLASGAMVYQASNAAFTASTATPTNNWTAGTVALSDDDGGAALFSLTNIKPGSANGGTKCITVSYTGSLAGTVKMYVTGYSSPAGGAGGVLGQYLRMSIEASSTTTNAACATFTGTGTYLTTGTTAGQTVDGLRTAATNFAGGVGAWTVPASSAGSPAVRSYQVKWYLPDTNDATNPIAQGTLDTLQAATVGAALQWEAQNT